MIFTVFCIVVAALVPVLLSTSQGKPSGWMWSEDQTFSTDYAAATLRKDPDKDFVVVNFTDTHIAMPFNISKPGKIYRTMKRVIDEAHPDLIIISGDISWFVFTRQCYRYFAHVMDGFGTPWTFTFGNHDHEGNSDLNSLVEVAQASKYCIIDKGPRNVMGVGNSFINIVEKQPNGVDKIVHTIILLDSGTSGYRYTEEQTAYDNSPITKDDVAIITANASTGEMKAALAGSAMNFEKYPYLEKIEEQGSVGATAYSRVKIGVTYSVLDYSQIAWYEWVLRGNEKANVENGFMVDSMPESTCVFHIPFNEYYYAYKQWLTAIEDNDVAGVLAMQAEGRMRMHEVLSSGTYNTGMFTKMKELGSTRNVIVGHDHVNDFSLVYQGIRLSYGVKTGERCYWENDGSTNGGTKLTISAGGRATELKQVYVDDFKR